MSGTVATYQGFPCRDVQFRRTRGWRADTTSVLLFAADFPHGFQFVTPSPGDLSRLRIRTQGQPDLSAIRGNQPRRPRALPKQRQLDFAGDLVMAEVDREGNDYLVVVDPLFCISLETVKRNADGSIAVVRARLVDARFFYAHGFLRRWSFNRTDGEGNYSKDSVKDDGAPFSLGEIAQEAAGSLFLTPSLSRYPKAWDETKPETEFTRFSSSTAAMVRLSQEHGTEELCLNLDGSVALWEAGEGKIGYAPDGKGAGNERDFPGGLQVYLQGTGQSRGVEATYPPDFVVVVGGLRVATIRMDELDPVLVIDNEPIPLTEETIKKLTKGKFGLAWLNKFVLAPQAYQNDVALDPRVVQLLREQAYRLWRIPKVEKEIPPPKGGAKGQPEQSSYRDKGPNAHLLPLRARAETVAGKRLPIRVDTYRFASVHRAMAPSREMQKIATIQKQLRDLKRQIQSQARQAAKPDPWFTTEVFYGFQDKYVSPRLLYAITGAQTHGVSYEQFQGMVSRARLLDRISEVSPGLAGQYGGLLGELFALDQELGGISKSLFELAKEAVEFEKKVAESRDLFETPDEEARDRADELRERVQDELRAIDRQREEQKTRERTGAQKRVKEQTAVFVRNLPRRLDPGARVFSAELGIVRTSDLCGHVAEEGVPVAEATSFVPKSPLVYFGAVLRPKVDKGSGRPLTGGSAATKNETKIPAVLSDTESYYTASFKRSAPGRAEQIELNAVPAGEGIPVSRPDLVELVPLEAESNKGQLDDTARSVALALFKKAEKVEAAKYSIARPWPVNCDGVVSGVEIAMRSNGKGFITTIVTGSESEILHPLGRTRPRVKRGAPSDAAAREGLLP
ncbi:MAG: hypothetical protein R3F62_03830 [Planctomycetota bacterium]